MNDAAREFRRAKELLSENLVADIMRLKAERDKQEEQKITALKELHGLAEILLKEKRQNKRLQDELGKYQLAELEEEPEDELGNP